MLLKDKVAVVYGAGGSVGGAVSRAFAKEGATVILAGRTLAPLEATATEITAAGGTAEAAVVDALDHSSIEELLSGVVARAGRIDISFNAISIDDIQGTPLLEMAEDDFVQPVATAMRTQFLTSTAAGRYMKGRGGVILAITARPDLRSNPNTGGFGVACAAIEAACRQLATELGPHGVRVVCLRSAGSPDSRGVREVFELHARNAGMALEEITAKNGAGTLLGHLPLLAEVADVAVIMASDRARAMTAEIANVTCGELVD